MLLAVQVASTAATARLVAPREFGLYATAQAAASLAGYFAMTAVGPGVQRRSELGTKTVGTALCLSLGGALLAATALWLGASVWARAWGVPEAAGTVRVIAITLFLTAASTVPVALVRRRLQFGRAAIIETSSLAVGLVAGVALAVELHSAVALALGQAIGAAGLLVGALVLVRHELKLSFDPADGRELLTFASQVGGLNFFAYLIYAAPLWFIARVFGPSVLGLCSRANLIVALPAEYALRGIFKITYPLYGRVRNDLRRTRILLDEALTLTTGLLWPVFALVAGGSPVIVAVLLGARWHDAAPLLALFALVAAAWVPCGVLTHNAEALGWMRIIAARQIVLLIGVAGTLIAVQIADLHVSWLLVGLAVSEWVTYAFTLQPFIRRRFLTAGAVLRDQMAHGTVALMVFGSATGCQVILAGASLSAQVFGQLVVAAVVFAALVIGRPRLPATVVLARRLGAPPGQGLARVAWDALR